MWFYWLLTEGSRPTQVTGTPVTVVVPGVHGVTLVQLRADFVKEFQKMKSEQQSIAELKEIQKAEGRWRGSSVRYLTLYSLGAEPLTIPMVRGHSLFIW